MKAKTSRNKTPEPKLSKLVPISATFPTDLLREVDQKAASLDLTRSQYFRRLAKIDLKLEESAAA